MYPNPDQLLKYAQHKVSKCGLLVQMFHSVLSKLEQVFPLVILAEIKCLGCQVSLIQKNKAFLLHARDCVESFDACTQPNISTEIGLILTFSLIPISASSYCTF
ncbi:hypothetical protein ARMGADRAFT_1079085 [Armillaria gallica]|uniref:Phospho-2-dehydro-3-deoxyheptonate aldolase n=1 Tax=Armillaria gallica TaxID=47427 RepID=A0A2H3E1G3_ARMGA|nr:hypothetical protein ARMGADRAFT_1079085 [Armillaria gallica]